MCVCVCVCVCVLINLNSIISAQNSVDLVVAVNPDVEEKDDTGTTSPRTMWPPPE